MNTVTISPSILSADFAHFERELHKISSADMAHVDVMDNHFVPNLTFGLPVVRRLQEVTPIPLDLHLMISDADRWAPQYAGGGIYSVTFHAEAATDCVATARAIRAEGSLAGLAIKPNTDVEPYLDQLTEYDQILIMTVEPGFGGQSFMSETMPKLAKVAKRAAGLSISLQVDGGITATTAKIAVEHGANCLVAGSAVYNGKDPAEAIAAIRSAVAEQRISLTGENF